MNKEESLALFAQGRDAWNAWAAKMTAEREALEAAGTWMAGRIEAQRNDATRAWHAAADVDFAEHQFTKRENFSGFVFPGDAEFGKAVFQNYAMFNKATFLATATFSEVTFSATATFSEVTFLGDARFDKAMFPSNKDPTVVTTLFDEATFLGAARFDEAVFSGNVLFDDATFLDDAGFDEAKFAGNAWFDKATFSGRQATFTKAAFSGEAWFKEATFSGNAVFNEATFSGDVSFDKAKFSGGAWFNKATFSGDTWFEESGFGGYTQFNDARFEKVGGFRAIDSKSFFSLDGATFLAVPDFIQAHFAEAPRLDNTRIQPWRFRRPTLADLKNYFKADRDLSARWRALKRLAVQGHDHMHELEFFKNELKTRRWVTDRPWHAVFWFGLFYGWLSDFGRSIARPLIWWAASAYVFALLYLGATKPPALFNCLAGSGDPWRAALWISARKALLFFGLDSSDRLTQHYACLYGALPSATSGQLPAGVYLNVPDIVIAYGVAQHIISAALLFFLLLAVRNHFRIK